jgi:RNA polymerase sigma-70 factor (ECF subfamily)
MESPPGFDFNLVKGDLHAFVSKRVKDPDLADDIVQEVFLKIHLKICQLKQSEKLLAWIYQIARNTIVDHFRHKKLLDPSMVEWESETNQLNECVARCLQKLLLTLPDKYSEAFRLSEIEGVPQTQLATRLGISYSGAKSRVQRARQMLRQKMEALVVVRTDVYGNVITCEDRHPCCCNPKRGACEP